VRSEEALSIFPEVFLRVRNNGPEPRENHLETIFEMRVFSWFRARVKEEISSVELADRVADVEKRIYRVRNLTKEISYACYEGALFSIKSDLEAEIEIESKRIENASKLKLKNEQPDDTEPDVPNKFKRKEVMALLQDLIPDFKEADHVAKAAFIVKLTPYRGEAKIAQEYSYLRRDDYLQLVEVWKDKFRKSGRGRNKRTT